MSTAIVYVRPGFGGILDYSESVLEILREGLPGARISVITAPGEGLPSWQGMRLARLVRAQEGVVLAEMGAGDASIFWCLSSVANERPVVVTVHDPGVIVQGLFSPRLPGGKYPRAKQVAAHVDNILWTLVGRHAVQAMLARCRARVVLNPAIDTVNGLPATYLPQPLYRPGLDPRIPPETSSIAYLGYWAPAKGLEDLLEAYRIIGETHRSVRLIVAGGTARGEYDPYERDFRRRTAALAPEIEMPGFIPAPRLDGFLRSLSALVLPYHPEVPGGASAMLLRAQEAGVPLIVGNTPQLRSQVDPANVTLVPPRDATALAQAIADHLDDPARHEEAARREQLRVHDEHGREAVSRRLLAIVKDACAPSP